jgi:hypothetical protein
MSDAQKSSPKLRATVSDSVRLALLGMRSLAPSTSMSTKELQSGYLMITIGPLYLCLLFIWLRYTLCVYLCMHIEIDLVTGMIIKGSVPWQFS